MIKKILLVLTLSVLTLEAVSQTVQKGIVYEYTSEKKKVKLAGVHITANGSTAVSDKNGNFTLKFNTLKKGDVIRVQQISKRDYVVMKSDDLDKWTVRNDGKRIELLMCKADQKNDLLALYYGIANKASADQLAKDTKENQRLQADKQIDRAEYGRRQADLKKQYMQDIHLSEELADFFSSLDATAINEASNKALELMTSGNVEEARQSVFSSRNIDHLRQFISKTDEKADLSKSQAARKRMLISSIITDINILRVHGGQAEIDSCNAYWKEVVKADSHNFETLRWATSFMLLQKRTKDAEAIIPLLLDAAKTDEDRFQYYRLAGLLQNDLDNSEEAERLYKKAIELGKRLAAGNPDKYELAYGTLLHSLAQLYYDCDRISESYNLVMLADSAVSSIDDSSDRLTRAKVLSFRSDVYALLSLIARLNKDYKNQINYCHRAIKALQESLDITFLISKKLNLGCIYSNLAGGYHDIYNKASWVNAFKYQAKAIETFREVYSLYPDRAIKYLADALANSAIAYVSLGRPAERDTAKCYYEEALKLYDIIARDNPNDITLQLAYTNIGIAKLYMGEQKLEEAIKYEKAGIDCLDQDVSPAIRAIEKKHMKSDLLIDLGVNYFYLGEKETSKNYTKQGLTLLRELIVDDPGHHDMDLGLALSNYGYMLYIRKDYKEAEEAYIEAMRSLTPSNATAGETVAAMNMVFAKHNMGDLCHTLHRYDEAQSNYEDALMYYSKKDDMDSGSIDYQLIRLLPKLAFVHIAKGDYASSRRNIDKALKINPDEPYALYVQSLLLCLEGKEQAAVGIMAKLKDATDENGVPVYDIARQDIQTLQDMKAIPAKAKTGIKKLNKMVQ